MHFKFKYLDENGQEQGFLSKKGCFAGTTLTLAGEEIPVEAILRARQRFNRLMLEVAGDPNPGLLALAITSGNATKLAAAINSHTSARWAELRQAALTEAGKGSTWRSVSCPCCGCSVDLSGFDRSAQVHCPYCDAVSTLQEPRPKGEAKLSCCENCGYFATPRPFTVFYFYFLLVVYGFSYRRTHLCHSCMRPQAWKMLAANLIFVLGVPVSLIQLIRSYTGGDIGAQGFVGLDAANSLAKRGRTEAAVERYQRIAGELSAAAGIHYNRGLAHAQVGQWAEAATALQQSLRDCANFSPAAGVLADCYRQLGDETRLAALTKAWEGDDAAA